MPNHRRALLSGLLLMLTIGTATATAQSIDSPYRFLDTRQSIGAFFGRVSTDPGALDLGPGSGSTLGVRYDLGISGPFVLEAELGLLSSSRAVMDTVPDDTTRIRVGSVDFRGVTARAGVRFNVTGPRTWHGLLPYLVFAGGITTDIADDTEPDASLPADVRFDFGTSFTGALGGGIEWLTSRGFTVRIDARTLLWKLKTPSAFLRGDQARVLPGDQWTQNVALTAGVALRF